jgi:hypothetical protein
MKADSQVSEDDTQSGSRNRPASSSAPHPPRTAEQPFTQQRSWQSPPNSTMFQGAHLPMEFGWLTRGAISQGIAAGVVPVALSNHPGVQTAPPTPTGHRTQFPGVHSMEHHSFMALWAYSFSHTGRSMSDAHSQVIAASGVPVDIVSHPGFHTAPSTPTGQRSFNAANIMAIPRDSSRTAANRADHNIYPFIPTAARFPTPHRHTYTKVSFHSVFLKYYVQLYSVCEQISRCAHCFVSLSGQNDGDASETARLISAAIAELASVVMDYAKALTKKSKAIPALRLPRNVKLDLIRAERPPESIGKVGRHRPVHILLDFN